MRYKFLTFILLSSSLLFSQEDKIVQAQQNAISSMSLVDALVSRVPGAKRVTDRMGNKNIAIEVGSHSKLLVMKFFGKLMG